MVTLIALLRVNAVRPLSRLFRKTKPGSDDLGPMSPLHYRSSHALTGSRVQGGGPRHLFDGEQLAKYHSAGILAQEMQGRQFSFEFQCSRDAAADVLKRHGNCISCEIPIREIALDLTKIDIVQLSKLHDLWIPIRVSAGDSRKLLATHECSECANLVSIFTAVASQTIFPPAKPKYNPRWLLKQGKSCRRCPWLLRDKRASIYEW